MGVVVINKNSGLRLKEYPTKIPESEFNSALKDFKDKHPEYFKMSDWNKKLEYLDSTQLQISGNIVISYIIGKGESNFNLISKLVSQVNLKEIEKKGIYIFIGQKITELKLESLVMTLLDLLTSKEKIEFLLSGVKYNVGKKAVRFLYYLEKIEKASNFIKEILVELENIKFTGIAEKKKLLSLINLFKSIPEQLNQIELDTSINNKESNIPINQNKETNIPINQNKESIKIKEENIKVESINNIIYANTKIKNGEQNFYFSFDSNNLTVLEIINKYLTSKNEIFFNDFILYLISKEVILTEEEVHGLVSVAINKKFFYQLELVDRVFPLSKYYLILKHFSITHKDILIIICKITRRQVNTSFTDSEIIEKIKECDDFVDLIQKILPSSNNNSTTFDSSVITEDYLDYKEWAKSRKQLKLQQESSMPIFKEPSINEEDKKENGSEIKFNNNKDIDDLSKSFMDISIEDQLGNNPKQNEEIDYYSELAKTEDQNECINYYKNNQTLLHLDKLIELSMKTQISILLRNNLLGDYSTQLSLLFDLLINDSNDLIFLIINSPFTLTLQVLFEKMFTSKSQDVHTLILKLIWRHSKETSKNISNSNNAQSLISVIDDLYKVYGKDLCNLSDTSIKVSLLHLQEICSLYSTNVWKFILSENLKKICRFLLEDKGLDLCEVKTVYNYYK